MKHFYLFIFFLLLSTTSVSQTRLMDSLALVDIYNALDGPNWTKQANWLSTESLETWEGVQIKENRVSELHRNNVGLKGEFPDAIYNLDALTELTLSSGEITGEIKDELLKLNKMERLSLFNTQLSGEIPTHLDSLDQLQFLSLARNNFIGNLPLLPQSIEDVNFSFNLLEGSIPASWNGLSIIQLRVDNNQLTGSLDIMESWASLNRFQGSFNDWDVQSFPSFLDKLPHLEAFICTSCHLAGEFPVLDWSSLPLFYQLIIENNDIEGNIDHLMWDNDAQLLWIEIMNNHFTGELPGHRFNKVDKFQAENNDITSVSSFNYEILNDIRLTNNKISLSNMLEVMPPLMNDEYISKFLLGDQRSKFPDDSLTRIEGESIVFQADEEPQGATYQWYYNNEQIDGATAFQFEIPMISLYDEGNYYCVLSHPTMIDDDEEILEFKGREWHLSVNLPSSIHTIKNEWNVYPNPSSDYIQLKGLNEKTYVEICDLEGRKCLDVELNNEDEKIDISLLPNGNFFIRVSSDNRIQVVKWQKK